MVYAVGAQVNRSLGERLVKGGAHTVFYGALGCGWYNQPYSLKQKASA